MKTYPARSFRCTGALPLLAAAILLLLAAPRTRAQMLDFTSIKNWTGTGPNQAALVVDWNDGKGPESLVWGYRFSGTTTTGLDMFRAIDAADPRLVLYTISFSFGDAVYGIGYDRNNNGGTFNMTPVGTETGSASDSGDHYAEGFNTRYWAYSTTDGASPYNGGMWEDPMNGASGRFLVNGSWDGWSISDSTFNAPLPGLPTPADAVPEPSALVAAGMGLGAVLVVAKRRRVARVRVMDA